MRVDLIFSDGWHGEGMVLCGYEMVRTRQIGIVSYGIIRCSCFIATACLWLAELALALALGLDEDE